jgi:hypothetical protein
MLQTDIYFTDVFRCRPSALDRFGAFNISLVNDLPLFIDPFLLFNSKKRRYRQLHRDIIRYLEFLRDRAIPRSLPSGLINAWFAFPEVRQNWLGYSIVGNRGTGLGTHFAEALCRNLNTIFANFGQETIARGAHLEKLCLIDQGVGRDHISDFTTNLIRGFLAEYTQGFAVRCLQPRYRRRVRVPKVSFNYDTETWRSGIYELPFVQGDYVLLTPKDLLTKDEIWINRADLYQDYDEIAAAIPNDELRDQINNYFLSVLPRKATKKDRDAAIATVLQRFPEVLEYYIARKERSGDRAASISATRVRESETRFISQVRDLVRCLHENTAFYRTTGDTYQDARARILFMKDVIENKGGHKIFYLDRNPVGNEHDLHVMFRLTWYASASDVSRETDDGRGPVDFKISRGSKDKCLVEFKLASNTHLKRNLQHQVEVYQRASDAPSALKVVMFFTEREEEKVLGILRELGLVNNQDIILIDARDDNKPSGSRA